jgi:hypothetical protein
MSMISADGAVPINLNPTVTAVDLRYRHQLQLVVGKAVVTKD